MIERIFRLRENGSNFYTEILAGLTIFATSAYVLAVIPSMLSGTNLNREAVFLAVCLGSGLLTIVMGCLTNLPVLMAPGLGITAYFSVVANQNGGIGSEAALVGILLSGIVIFILTISNGRRALFNSIPLCLKNALMAGVGMFIIMVGLKVSNLITVQAHLSPVTMSALQSSSGHINLSSLEWNLAVGYLRQPAALLTLIGLAITAIMIMFQVKGAILISLIITTLLGIPLGLTNIHNINFSLPNINNLSLGNFNFDLGMKYFLDAGVLSVACVFAFIGLMDNSTNLMTIISQVRSSDKNQAIRVTKKAMLVDAVGINLASFLGIPFFVYYLESLAGISVGGRTWLTALTVGMLFLLSLVLSPIFLIIPTAATAPALIIIGIFVISSMVQHLNLNDFSESFPALFTMVLMPFTFNIADSISGGVIFYMLLKLFQKKYKEISWIMYIFALLIIARYVFL